MPLPPKPGKAIVPIFRVTDDGIGEKSEFLGTGFFIEPGHRLITAKHVFERNPLSTGQQYVLGVHQVGAMPHCLIEDVHLDPDLDIASGSAQYADAVYLSLAKEKTQMNKTLLSFEYSRTVTEEKAGKELIIVTPATQMGHAIMSYEAEFPQIGKGEIEVLELSFPLLRGASGAPVLDALTGEVVGMTVVNHEQELQPAQTIRAYDEEKVIEEIKYYLPNALAIGLKHLSTYLQQFDKK